MATVRSPRSTRPRRRTRGHHARLPGAARAVPGRRSRSWAARCVTGFALQPSTTATSIRGDVVTDGPFIEAKEVVAGFFILEAPDLDVALRDRQAQPGHARRRRRGPPAVRLRRRSDRRRRPATSAAGRERAVADAHRREWAFVLAATARVAGDLDLAEECVQEAYVAALDAWARDGMPHKPGAWLTADGRRKALDVLRRRAGVPVEDAAARGAGCGRDGRPRVDEPTTPVPTTGCA